MMNRFCVVIGVWLVAGFLYAQQDEYEAFKQQQLQNFDIFSANQQAKYDAYRSELNEQYARFMAESWQRMTDMHDEEIQEEQKHRLHLQQLWHKDLAYRLQRQKKHTR